MLHPDYNYTVSIAAATEQGMGPFSDPITVRTNMDGKLFFQVHTVRNYSNFCYIKLPNIFFIITHS